MVNTNHVVHGGHGFHPLHPPAIAGQAQIMPPIQGIPPQLTILGKIVRRNPCHPLGNPVPIQLENLRVGPRVRTVLRHVNGHIAKQHESQAIAVLLQCHPLAEEKHLHKKMILHILRQLRLVAEHSFFLVQANVFFRPLCPHGIPEVMLHRREQCHVFRPGMTASKLLHLAPHFLPGLPEAQPKPSFLVDAHLIVIHMGRILIHIGRQSTVIQQAFPPQFFQRNHQRIPRKDAGRLIGRLAVAYRPHRQHLPQLHASLVQEICKIPCFLTKAANAVLPRQ